MPAIAAFFDIDLTVLRCNSGTEWVRFLRRQGEMPLWRMAQALVWIGRYKLALLDMEAVIRRVVAEMAGDSEPAMRQRADRFFAEVVAPAISPLAEAAIMEHRQAGHRLALLTSSTQYVAEPLAALLHIEHVLCTRLLVDGERFTGRYEAPACAGAGKVHWAERFATAHDVDLGASYFYTDSYTDLPMLERVGEPRVVNADPRLARRARRSGWATMTW